MTAETKQEMTKDSLYEKGFRDGQLTERSRHEKELKETQIRFCIVNCPVVNRCKNNNRCPYDFKRVFGGEKKQ